MITVKNNRILEDKVRHLKEWNVFRVCLVWLLVDFNTKFSAAWTLIARAFSTSLEIQLKKSHLQPCVFQGCAGMLWINYNAHSVLISILFKQEANLDPCESWFLDASRESNKLDYLPLQLSRNEFIDSYRVVVKYFNTEDDRYRKMLLLAKIFNQKFKQFRAKLGNFLSICVHIRLD